MGDLVFDTETTGLPVWHQPSEHPDQPRLVQLAMVALDSDLVEAASRSMIVRPDGWTIPADAAAIHGITTEMAMDEGVPLADVMDAFRDAVEQAGRLVAHNIKFDARIMRIQQFRLQAETLGGAIPEGHEFDDFVRAREADHYCTMMKAYPIMGLKSFKGASLGACVRHFFDEDLPGAHDALVDARACARVYRHLRRIEA